MPETKIGVITHHFGKIGVAVIKATETELSVGDTIHIKGHTTDYTQVVESMEIEHQQIQKLKKGEEAGLKVTDKVHENDEVFKVTD
ncbi:hypothetical protein CH330_07600 [candidate division WOR-3 bacterium JGI_Cruoil_03_51_56]|uniref:Translation elongation factor-like protein n=1 Tax=candidate division WOR-3 bacterium JGI_Cruoil_03_51_56 TaxID=1973747 RepID=A0A235BRC7_UNCW3|nr:MAG: hypothetical protein CH330_07600 [candidate division WOR-3 bacterium JGI_Cruoil_03_51_56]